MHLIGQLIVGAIIGAIAGAIVGKGKAMGCIANILAGLIGAYVGQALPGISNFGPSLAGMHLIPSIIGAIIVVTVASLIFGRNNK